MVLVAGVVVVGGELLVGVEMRAVDIVARSMEMGSRAGSVDLRP